MAGLKCPELMAAMALVTILASCGGNGNSPDGNPSQLASCVQLAPGQSQPINHELTTLPSRYYLSRLADRDGHASYHVEIPVEFRLPGNTGVSPDGPRMVAKANQCLSSISPYLSGPNGEQLTVQLAPPRRNGMGPFQIELWSQLKRGHSQKWDSTWLCPNIAHETMHLLGLVDEYQETQLQQYDCRSVGPDTSLMSQPWAAFQYATPALEFVECTCSAGSDDSCPDRLAAMGSATHSASAFGATSPANNQCPDGTDERVYQTLPEWVALPLPTTATWAGADREHFRFLRKVPPSRPSLLFGPQFRVIVEPGCRQTNRLYYGCSANAYRTSGVGGGCRADVPPECAAGNNSWVSGSGDDLPEGLPSFGDPALR